jgi:hypothetical protein
MSDNMETVFGFALQYFHILGLVIGMGAAIVIETLGFISRKSSSWTSVTIDAHHVTKPLIWTGTLLLGVTWIMIAGTNVFSFPYAYKTLLILLLLLNGSYLSFVISPRLIMHKKKHGMAVLSSNLQSLILPGAVVSVIGWLAMVFLTLLLWP